MSGLVWLGRHGQLCLIAGLLAGLTLPGLAETLRPWIGALISLLLLVTGIRVGARAALGSLKDISRTLARICVFQMLLPLLAVGLFAWFGLLERPLALAVALMLSAPSVTGAPNFAIMVKQDPAPGMRLLVLSTLLFPVTALPLLMMLDIAEAGVSGALFLVLGLLAAILGAVGAGFALRAARPALGGARAKSVLDGVAAVLLGIVVIGLMSAVGPLLSAAPGALFGWVLVAVAINFGLVAGSFAVLRGLRAQASVASAIYAGNRNIALYLIVLPDSVAAPLMIFIGCYQIPMYLTPFFLARLPLRAPPEGAGKPGA